MSKFRLGDLIKCDAQDSKIYIIIDVIEFTDYSNPALSSEVEYGTMQIHPVQMHSEYGTIMHNNSYLYYADGSPLAQDFHRTIKEERAMRGFTSVPDFVKILNTNMKSKNVYLEDTAYYKDHNRKTVTVIGATDEKRERIKAPFRQERKATPNQDRTKPFPISTVDECLDAMNSADLLYNMFGDKKYLQMKERALAKLVELTS